MFINKCKVKFGLSRFVRKYYVTVKYKLGSAMVDATPREVVSSIALSVILEIYEIGGTVIFENQNFVVLANIKKFLNMSTVLNFKMENVFLIFLFDENLKFYFHI